MPKTDLLNETDGQRHLTWWCPGCEDFHGVPVAIGEHQAVGGADRRAWGWNGDREKPTLTPSVLVNKQDGRYHVPGRPTCHLYLRDGVIEFLGDCTHSLAGRHVPLEDTEAANTETTMAKTATTARLERVTITGADDLVDPHDLVALAATFPFVEFGILFSATRSQENAPRYPCRRWLTRLWREADASGQRLNLSAHLVGRYMRDAINTVPTWWDTFPELVLMFDRVQLNCSREPFTAMGIEFLALETRRRWERAQIPQPVPELIIQIQDAAAGSADVTKLIHQRVRPFFDNSGGRGELPARWPIGLAPVTGYAGGLRPDNLATEIPRILEAATAGVCERVWIDLETGVRTPTDAFDVELAAAALEAAAPFVGAPS